MENISTISEMMRQFHLTMKATCEYCKYSKGLGGGMVWCMHHDGRIAKNNDDYCQYWDKQEI